MEITNAYAVLRVLVEHNHEYPAKVRRALLEAACEMADACLDTIDARGPDPADTFARSQISAGARRIEKHLLTGDLTEGFMVAFDAFQKGTFKPRSQQKIS
jgi:hypothetical protein